MSQWMLDKFEFLELLSKRNFIVMASNAVRFIRDGFDGQEKPEGR